MAKLVFDGQEIHTAGNLPEVSTKAPGFVLVKRDLSELSLDELAGKNVILNIFPSLDTGVCAASVRKFNKEAANLPGTVVLAISADLPFAAERFCTTEGIEKVIPVSVFRNPEFAEQYGVLMIDGPLKGLLARSVIVINPEGYISHIELVTDIKREPNYQTAINSIM